MDSSLSVTTRKTLGRFTTYHFVHNQVLFFCLFSMLHDLQSDFADYVRKHRLRRLELQGRHNTFIVQCKLLLHNTPKKSTHFIRFSSNSINSTLIRKNKDVNTNLTSLTNEDKSSPSEAFPFPNITPLSQLRNCVWKENVTPDATIKTYLSLNEDTHVQNKRIQSTNRKPLSELTYYEHVTCYMGVDVDAGEHVDA
ncbi:hypothetical protein DEO72_LG3g1350 [Vigna unguiculata]|uniref:Uncharacterized protein n=1 Tax=Vigna unguiculata TaxID=3917 RepID=A0A4D6LF08_VIGUN|nr:hypothetical protein DEO72_LG3g1350 [Vigna unguiculata]